MDLQDYVAIIRRRLWILLAVPFVAVAAAGFLSWYVLTPVYRASATLWVVQAGRTPLNMEDLMFNRNLVRTYSEVAKSRLILDRVLARLGLPPDAEGLQQRLWVSAVDQTEVLRITVEDSDPEKAALIANEVAAAFSEEIEQFVRLENVRVLDKAHPPTVPDRPRKLINLMLGAALGGVAALALVLVLEALDLTVRTVSEVERQMGLPALGTIPVFRARQARGDEAEPLPASHSRPTAGEEATPHEHTESE